MSKDKIPDGTEEITLRCFLMDNIATVEACMDSAIGHRWHMQAYKRETIIGNEYTVHVVYPKESERITKRLAKAIAKRWMNGEYFTTNLREGLQ